ncbi:MAG: glycosyltransferase family 87 protein [Anaerolineae bacterium]
MYDFSRLAVIVLVLAAVFFVAGGLVPGATRLTWGFSAYYTGARLLAEGADMSRLYDQAWFRAQVAAFGITGPQTSDIWFVNPPTTTLLMAGLAGLTPPLARLAWTGFNLLVLPAALLLLIRTLGVRPSLTEWMLLATMVLVFNPLHENFRWGQTYVLLLLLHVTFLYGYLEKRDLVAGLSLALMLTLKTYGAFLILFLLFRRRWRALLHTLGVAALVVLVSLPRLALPIWETYLLDIVPSVRAYAGIGVTGYQTLSSFIEHVFSYDPLGSPRPLMDVPWLATALVIGLSAFILVTTLRTCRQPGCRDRDFEALSIAAFTAISVPLAPLAEEHHFTVLILPLVVLGAHLLRRGLRIQVLTTGLAGYGLLAAPLPFMHPRLTQGWWAFLAYPKLYGALLLWLALLFHLRAYRQALAEPKQPPEILGEGEDRVDHSHSRFSLFLDK